MGSESGRSDTTGLRIEELRIEELSRADCKRLLGEGGVGRLAMSTKGVPEIRPVNFALSGGVLIVRTGAGSILNAAQRGDAGAFEIDGFDRLEHTGWSVVVTGKLCEITHREVMLGLPLRPWASGTKDRFVALSLDRISGIRIPPGRGNR
jgi:hypothetical protein